MARSLRSRAYFSFNTSKRARVEPPAMGGASLRCTLALGRQLPLSVCRVIWCCCRQPVLMGASSSLVGSSATLARIVDDVAEAMPELRVCGSIDIACCEGKYGV